MSALVGYASSDDEEDIQPEWPTKIAKTAPTNSSTSPQALSTKRPAQHIQKPQSPPRDADIPSSGPALGPAAPSATNAAAPSEELHATPFSPYSFEKQRLRELTMPTVPNFDIPDSPSPPPQNSEEAATLAATTKKFERFLELKKQGIHFNERLQKTSSLQNPGLLPKLMDFAGISKEDSYASSLPDELAVPVKWPEESYIENLMRQNERKEKKRLAERDKMDFIPATKPAGPSANDPATSEGVRKSRFDK